MLRSGLGIQGVGELDIPLKIFREYSTMFAKGSILAQINAIVATPSGLVISAAAMCDTAGSLLH